MKLITAFIQPERLEFVSRELLAANIFDMTITTCCGYGRDPVLVASFRGGPDAPELLATLLLEVIVPASRKDDAVQAIVRGARTGCCGDGKLFITTLERVVRINSGTEIMTSAARERVTRIRRVRSPVHHPAL